MTEPAIIPKPAPPLLDSVFLSPAAADELLGWCLECCAWHSETLTLFGRNVDVPRQVAWFAPEGVNYRYSRRDHVGEGWPVQLEGLAGALGSNHALLNRYESGAHYMGWHTDDERDVFGPVRILSLGQTRRLRWRKADGGSQPIDLPHGSLLTLDGRVPHTLCRSSRPMRARVSISFRTILRRKAP